MALTQDVTMADGEAHIVDPDSTMEDAGPLELETEEGLTLEEKEKIKNDYLKANPTETSITQEQAEKMWHDYLLANPYINQVRFIICFKRFMF